MSDGVAGMDVLAPQCQRDGPEVHDVPDVPETPETSEHLISPIMGMLQSPEPGRSGAIDEEETPEQAQSSQDIPSQFTKLQQGGSSVPEICIACYSGTEEEGTLIRTCPRHNGNHFYHVECIRSLFLAACRDESLMPPHFCGPMRLSIGLSVLSTVEQELFMAKYEEWSATDRVYCPVPSCSAFIPRRMIPGSNPETEEYERPNKGREPNLSISGLAPYNKFHLDDLHNPPEVIPIESSLVSSSGVTVSGVEPGPKISAAPIDGPASDNPVLRFTCPKCKVSLCTKCHQRTHLKEPCVANSTEIDPAVLRRLGIKRCPKCAQGVKIMFGCSHIRCRCGANFCSKCMQPIDVCTQHGCRPLLYDADTEPDNVIAEAGADPIEQDLDEGVDWQNSGFDFGEEPMPGEYSDPWGCYHIWVDMRESRLENEIEATCHFCWEKTEIKSKGSESKIFTCQLCDAGACRKCTEKMAAKNAPGELKELHAIVTVHMRISCSCYHSS